MQLEQTLEMYRPIVSQNKERIYTTIDLESLSATALYTGPLGDSLGFGSDIVSTDFSEVREVGESRFQTWIADPQPGPDLIIKTPSSFEMVSVQAPVITSPSSVEYINSKGISLGGITSLTPSEIVLLAEKYLSDNK